MVVRFQSSPIPFPSMAIMTRNRKRPEEECTNVNDPNSSSPNSSNSQRKRPRFSSISTRPDSSSSFNSTASRISRYPEAKPPLVREVHAPCRPRKFDLFTNPRRESSFKTRASGDFQNNMGNFLSSNYRKTKKEALDSCRFFPKGKEVIDLDTDSHRYEVSEDSSIQEVQIVEDGDAMDVVEVHDLDAMDVVEVHDLDAKVADGGIRQKSMSSVDSELTSSNLKLVNAEKNWESLAVNREHDLSSVHVYKKLLEAVRRREDTTDRLRFEIKLHEKRKDAFGLLRPKKELVEEVPHEPFIPLTKEELNEVENAFYANRKKILVTHENSNIEISAEKFQCLRPGAWLNDEVINLYLELLKEREKREPRKFLKCHFFNTFFYKKLISGRNGYDFKSVRRWTSQRKLGYGLLECDKIFIPIHKEIHWCLAVINKKDKKFQYLDSLKGMDSQVLQVLSRYFVDEVKDKTGKDIDVSSWETEFVEDLPEQENGFDCGVFMIKYADFYSRGLGLCFNQEHMPYFRLRTAKEILRLKAN